MPMSREPRDAGRDEPIVDARGLLCPIPVIRAGEGILDVTPGGTLLLVADDPAAEEDIRLWCGGQGHSLESVESRDGALWMRIRRRSD
jgi:tRNA 2-thiouridine synthesizing protein A